MDGGWVSSPSPHRRPLTKVPGRAKAAILLLSLGPEQAAEVFKHLNRDEAERLAIEMARTGRVDPTTANAVIEEALDMARARAYLVEGGVDYAREILERSMGAERAAGIMRRLAGMVERRPFEFLRSVPPMQVHNFLASESPQTAALVIANLPPITAAQVLAEFDNEEQADISARVAMMNDTNPEILVAVEDVVRDKLASALDHEFAAAGGVKSLAEILGNSDRGNRAQRARPPRARRRQARRGGARAAVHLRGHPPARRPRQSRSS